MLILRQQIGYQQGRKATALTADPELKKQLTETEKQLHSILTKWKFGDQALRTSEEFLNKFEPWVDNKIKAERELKDFLARYSVNNLPELANYMVGISTGENQELKDLLQEYSATTLTELAQNWKNTEQDYLSRIEAARTEGESRVIIETPEDYEELKRENEKLKTQLETYSKGEDWETKMGEIIASLEQEVRELTEENERLKSQPDYEELEGERDLLKRDKITLEQEVLFLNNQVRNKSQAVTIKEDQIENLKKEKSSSEIALNKTITELKKTHEDLKKKYSKQGQLLDGEQCENNKLTEKIEQLEAEIKQLKERNWK